MPIGAVQHIVVDLNTAATVALGTDITHTLTADPISTDETPSDNTYAFTDSVVGSYDPNDKILSPAVLTPEEVALSETPIEYTIRFQNTGTYLAERVVILDTLSADLQWETMRYIASSHQNTWYIVDGVLHVIHNDIMLPDSNTNEAASHGFFKFSMLPKTDLVNGSTIENIAHIIFDFNTPIITPPAVFMVDVAAGVVVVDADGTMRVTPNPANDRIRVGTGSADPLPYRIMNALGQPVMSGLLGLDGWLDIEALPKGAYVLEVRTPMARSSLRWIKQ
ncbi:MAG: T9SS type A sorting domain-containing protein [Flavobacteriales bacterium]|nr:T9SS type A sorting domain-containing protein [Flavobacteriales bacterium]